MLRNERSVAPFAGLIPALAVSRTDVRGSMQNMSRTIAGGRTAARGVLVISEVALAGGAEICVAALDLFVSAYGAEAGNLALRAKALEVTDHQHPHRSDEVYVVVSGRATLRVDGHDHPVGPGSVVSVDQDVEHGFIDIVDDLTVLVVFAPAEIPD